MKRAYESWKKRIKSASSTQLVIITLELALFFIEEASETEGAWALSLEKARRAVGELICVLDFEYRIAHDLYDIYEYVNKLICLGALKDDACAVEEAASTLRKLLDSWKSIENVERPKSVDRIFLGLTYTNGRLDEIALGDLSRGFQA
ncbi:MAG: flagellar protein FliS [Clostridiales bacterium]|jgi:flagellar protein FliS|nr:flagellar protein FliS [Clostridiales bacterium]